MFFELYSSDVDRVLYFFSMFGNIKIREAPYKIYFILKGYPPNFAS